MEKEEFVKLFSKRLDKLEVSLKEICPNGIKERETATIPLGFLKKIKLNGIVYNVKIARMDLTKNDE